MAEFVQLLCSSAKLDRDRAVQQLQTFLDGADSDALTATEQDLQKLLSDNQSPWETKHGALMGSITLLRKGKCSQQFANIVQPVSLSLLDDGESRVRLAAGEALGALCLFKGVAVYESVKEKILEGVQSNLERKPLEEIDPSDQMEADNLVEKLVTEKTEKRRRSADAEQIFHDTAGWKSLETYMKCLQFVIEGCGTEFNRFVDPELLNLITQTLTHTNRFVRETGYYVCASLVGCNSAKDGSMSCGPEDNEIYKNGQHFAEHLSKGLADNWSQVRLAASVATRQFLQGLSPEMRNEFYSLLLPPLCLNRYYVAEGVRIYNQDTWREITHGEGKHLLEVYIQQVVDFYISQTEADNHAVREAACACVAELGTKIDKDAVRPYVSRLLEALLVCFKDDSWPVRDASCVACGNFVLCFPEESRAKMEVLYPLFFENLQDNIPSVRQGAALALTNVIRAYGAEGLTVVMAKVKEGLEGLENQPANAERYSSMDKGPATYGVVKKLRDNDMELHTDKQMYSCGSLAPKMHRGKRGGGCMDHQFRRPSEPWELADGCIHMLGELSEVSSATKDISAQLPLLAKAASHQHYTQHVHFLETLCKQLPHIAKGLGKKPFKMYLEMFFDAIFYATQCDNALTASAASQCLNTLGTFIGPGILRGRVEQYNPKYLDQLSTAQYMAAF